MKEGRVVITGSPSEIITADRVNEVFGIDAVVITDPVTQTPMVVRR